MNIFRKAILALRVKRLMSRRWGVVANLNLNKVLEIVSHTLKVLLRVEPGEKRRGEIEVIIDEVMAAHPGTLDPNRILLLARRDILALTRNPRWRRDNLDAARGIIKSRLSTQV